MSFADWPVGLPYRSERDPWDSKPRRDPQETPMAGGNVRLRRRPGDRTGTMQWGRQLFPAEAVVWETFADTIDGGTQRFWMPVSLNGSTYELRLVQITGGIPALKSLGGGRVMLTLTLLVFPVEMTEAVPVITSTGNPLTGTGTVGATVELQINGVVYSQVATGGIWTRARPVLAAGAYQVRARYVGGPWSVPLVMVA